MLAVCPLEALPYPVSRMILFDKRYYYYHVLSCNAIHICYLNASCLLASQSIGFNCMIYGVDIISNYYS